MLKILLEGTLTAVKVREVKLASDRRQRCMLTIVTKMRHMHGQYEHFATVNMDSAGATWLAAHVGKDIWLTGSAMMFDNDARTRFGHYRPVIAVDEIELR